MSLLGSNIKRLRAHQKLSQTAMAEKLALKRTTLSAYENGVTEPNISTLVKIASHFKINIDRLLKQDLNELTDFELRKIELGYDYDVAGKHLRILATTVDNNNKEQAEVIPQKAKAGYTAGYANPEFIANLPKISLPFLSNHKKYRVFPIEGDSMPPVEDGSYVIGSYLQDWQTLKPLTPCIVVTKDDGIVFKLVTNNILERSSLMLYSTNPTYQPYEVNLAEVLEIWEFSYYISSVLPKANKEQETIVEAILQLQRDVQELKVKQR